MSNYSESTQKKILIVLFCIVFLLLTSIALSKLKFVDFNVEKKRDRRDSSTSESTVYDKNTTNDLPENEDPATNKPNVENKSITNDLPENEDPATKRETDASDTSLAVENSQNETDASDTSLSLENSQNETDASDTSLSLENSQKNTHSTSFENINPKTYVYIINCSNEKFHNYLKNTKKNFLCRQQKERGYKNMAQKIISDFSSEKDKINNPKDASIEEKSFPTKPLFYEKEIHETINILLKHNGILILIKHMKNKKLVFFYNSELLLKSIENNENILSDLIENLQDLSLISKGAIKSNNKTVKIINKFIENNPFLLDKEYYTKKGPIQKKKS